VGARAAWAAILLGSLVAGLVLLRDHGSGLWPGVHVQKIRVPFVVENVFVIDAPAQTDAAPVRKNSIYFVLTECPEGVLTARIWALACF
jgi:hypothetical protein